MHIPPISTSNLYSQSHASQILPFIISLSSYYLPTI